MRSGTGRRLACGLTVVAYAVCLPAHAQTVPSYRSATCNAICDLFSALTDRGGRRYTVLPRPAFVPRTVATLAPKTMTARKNALLRRPKIAAHPTLRRAAPRVAARPPAVRTLKLLTAACSPETTLSSRVAAAMAQHRMAVQTTAADAAGSALATSEADMAVVPGPLLTNDIGRVVATLGPEDLHLLAGADIHSIEDLRNRPVALGSSGSATETLTIEVLKSAGIIVKEVPLDFADSLEALRQGDVVALAVLAPKPFEALNDLPANAGLHLLSVPQTMAWRGTRPSSITHQDYPGLVDGEPVKTLAVNASLVVKYGADSLALVHQLKPVFASTARPAVAYVSNGNLPPDRQGADFCSWSLRLGRGEGFAENKRFEAITLPSNDGHAVP